MRWDAKVHPRNMPSKERDLRILTQSCSNGMVAPAERGKVEGAPLLGEEVVVNGRLPGAALVEGGVGLVEGDLGTGMGWRGRARGGARVTEALDRTRAKWSPS